MPTLYLEERGKPPKRVAHGTTQQLKTVLSEYRASLVRQGFDVVGDWNDWVASHGGILCLGYYLNEIGGSFDEKSGSPMAGV